MNDENIIENVRKNLNVNPKTVELRATSSSIKDYLKNLYPEPRSGNVIPNKLKLKMGVSFEEALMDYIDFAKHHYWHQLCQRPP